MWRAEPTLAGRCVAAQHWGMPPLNVTQLAIGERVQHELLVVERVGRPKATAIPSCS
jgi:hypothetical protein